MTEPTPALGLVCSGSGGVESVRSELVEPLIAEGWQVAVTLTPTANAWLEASGERDRLEKVTGFPVRSEARMPDKTSPHPQVTCYAVVPASANTVAKLALGIADNQALTTICEALGTHGLPVVIFPRVNAAHARQPAWESHIAGLRRVDADVIYGDDVWPLHEPRSAPSRELPWAEIRKRIKLAANTR